MKLVTLAMTMAWAAVAQESAKPSQGWPDAPKADKTAPAASPAPAPAASAASAPEDAGVTFRSDVTLVRVDVQVVDRENRALTRLEPEDFVLRENGRIQKIRNFVKEDMPIDVLFLLDVSGSMRPHVERMMKAADQAFGVLNSKDRIAVMVFDRQTRVRMPFRNVGTRTVRDMENVLRGEDFRGGTDITRALLDAADYSRRQGRKDARRAIVILTDDQTEFERDEDRVVHALADADTVMSALLVPNAMRHYYQNNQFPGGGRRRGGLGYPGGGWPGGGYPGGGYPGGGGRYPGGGYPGGGQSRTKSAGTAEIARESGGDSMPSDHASALEDTLSRLRQRYAIHFLMPAGVRAGERRSLDIVLQERTRRNHPEVELRYRHYYIAEVSSAPPLPGEQVDPEPEPEPRAVTQRQPQQQRQVAPADDDPPVTRRKRAVSDGGGGARGPVTVANPQKDQ
ncbi:MAG: VWA domain-containing protein [Bryobacteraceae bacterium]